MMRVHSRCLLACLQKLLLPALAPCAGVPCLTLAGACHAHNVGASLLTDVGLEQDWVAHSGAAPAVATAAGGRAGAGCGGLPPDRRSHSGSNVGGLQSPCPVVLLQWTSTWPRRWPSPQTCRRLRSCAAACATACCRCGRAGREVTGAAILGALGLRLACSLACRTPQPAMLPRATLPTSLPQSRMCNAPAFVSQLEDTYHALWQRWLREQQQQQPAQQLAAQPEQPEELPAES